MLLHLTSLRWYVLVGVLALSVTACAPSISPLYRDFQVQQAEEPVAERIEAALAEAGWQVVPASAPNAVATEERKVKSWALYSVVVSLEVVPVGEEYVRLYLHPYRKYFTGSRSKIPFLDGSLQRALLKDLYEAFNKEGLQAIGTGRERDRQTSAR